MRFRSKAAPARRDPLPLRPLRPLRPLPSLSAKPSRPSRQKPRLEPRRQRRPAQHPRPIRACARPLPRPPNVRLRPGPRHRPTASDHSRSALGAIPRAFATPRRRRKALRSSSIEVSIATRKAQWFRGLLSNSPRSSTRYFSRVAAGASRPHSARPEIASSTPHRALDLGVARSTSRRSLDITSLARHHVARSTSRRSLDITPLARHHVARSTSRRSLDSRHSLTYRVSDSD
jgi:hypothetical protein